ncbi:hypothetical protein SNEBB_000367 [Seison nebaliae]|nr:hypothetical protein SNEBB_000367 [Seison nebaliae]
MNALRRSVQWKTFTRTWYLFNAEWQDAVLVGDISAKYLQGKHKPFYHELSDCGDYVVIINSEKIALKDPLWRTHRFSSHTGYARGFSQISAWKKHEDDPTYIARLCTHNAMRNNVSRKMAMARLFVFPDNEESVPKNIWNRITDQIECPMRIPKRLNEYSEEEIEQFPKLFQFPQLHTKNSENRNFIEKNFFYKN